MNLAIYDIELQLLSGVAAILNFPIPEVDIEEDEEEGEEQGTGQGETA